MIAHHTVIAFVASYPGHRAPAHSWGTYATLFVHHAEQEPLLALTATRASTFDGLKRALQKLKGATIAWKGGEVQPGNPFKKRLGDLTTAVKRGSSGNIPTADKFHTLLCERGGFVLAMMFPVAGFDGERAMMQALSERRGMVFDNYTVTPCTERILNLWVPCKPLGIAL